jgi:hypothetical protein
VSEADLLRCVLDLAKLYGWRSFHARPAMTAKGYRTAVSGDGKGFPDLVLVKDRVIAAELKSDVGKPTRQQADWLIYFHLANVETAVWRPADWHDGTILRTLSGKIEQ